VKFLCSHCDRLVALERFSLDGSTLVVTCGVCGEQNRSTSVTPPIGAPAVTAAGAVPPAGAPVALRTPVVEAIARAAASAKDNPFAVPDGHCPKCLTRRMPDVLACPSCGMSFGQAVPEAFDPSDWLKGEWLALLSSWGEDGRHERLRAEAMNKGELAPLGRLYRLRLASFPEDPYAVRGRDEVLRLAVLPQVTVRQLHSEPNQPTWKYLALSVIIVGCLLALFFLVRQMLALT
jgi:hypothetical protein